jgi:hypothetical protein
MCRHCAPEAYKTAQQVMNRAVGAVGYAIRSGRLRHPSMYYCADCFKRATEYDHRDYTKPLVVDPVCHTCNSRRGPGIVREQEAAA